MITESALVALAGLVAIVALLFLLITRFKWHVFLSLLVPIVLFALIPGIDRQTFIDAFEQGFGRTIQSIAVVIVLARCWPRRSSTPAASSASRPR